MHAKYFTQSDHILLHSSSSEQVKSAPTHHASSSPGSSSPSTTSLLQLLTTTAAASSSERQNTTPPSPFSPTHNLPFSHLSLLQHQHPHHHQIPEVQHFRTTSTISTAANSQNPSSTTPNTPTTQHMSSRPAFNFVNYQPIEISGLKREREKRELVEVQSKRQSVSQEFVFKLI